MLEREIRLECLKLAAARGGHPDAIIEMATKLFSFASGKTPVLPALPEDIQRKDQVVDAPDGFAEADL